MKSNKGNGKRPEQAFQFGAVRAAIWSNTATDKKGQTFDATKVALDRAYKDAEGDWQHTNRFGLNDIPKAILALQKAYEYLVTRREGDDVEEETVE